MKLSILLLSCLVAVAFCNLSKEELFTSFKNTYNREYSTVAEERARFEIFKSSLDRIDYLNSVSKHATFAVNEFADLSELEFKEIYLNDPIDAAYAAQSCLAHGVSHPQIEKVGALPTSFDWRTTNKVSEVKNQGQCGSCWTFSTTGVIESAYAIKNNVDATLLLSEQAIVDCSHNCSMVNGESVCNSGCNGGWPWAAVTDVMRWGGLPTESEYPYTAVTGTCSLSGKKLEAVAPKSYHCLSGPDQKGGPADEKTLMPTVLMNSGPLSIALDATMFQFYYGGIMNPYFPNYECSPDSLDHAVLIVGWGEEDSTPYWIVKNSWGASWGEKGYVRMYRGEGLCGLNAAVMSVTL